MNDENRTNLYLTGFMGAGKSTTGQVLAKILGYEFVDLDQLIVEREGRTIADIFAEEGEDYFRDCESRVLAECQREAGMVYATGGGVVLRDENRRLMRCSGQIIYLQTSWPVLRERLQDSVDRPLVRPDKSWDAVERLWASRQPFYRDADLIVMTDGKTPELVADQIASMIKVEQRG